MANQWDLSSAAAEYYTSLEEATGLASPSPPDNDPDPDEDEHPAVLSAAGSTPQPIPTTSRIPPPPSQNSREPPRKKFATLGDLSGAGGGGSSHVGHGHNNDDDDEEDLDPDQDFFAGGEKSGLAVHNPDDIKKKILERAKK